MVKGSSGPCANLPLDLGDATRLKKNLLKRWLPWALLGVCVAALLFVFDPSRNGFYPQCLFHRTTGLLCPGCGSLRALHQLLHGNILAALQYNALLICSLPVLAWLSWRILNPRQRPANQRFSPVWLWVFLGVLLLFGVVRNLPFARAIGLAP